MQLHAFFGVVLLALAPATTHSNTIGGPAAPGASVTPAFSLARFGPAGNATKTDAFTGPVLAREDLLRQVLTRNPSLKAARAAWDAAQEQEPQVASLSDPDVFYSFGPLSIAADNVRFGQVLGVSQRLPFPGTLRHRGERARAEAAVARHDLDTLRLELATLASQLYDEDVFLIRALEINVEHMALVEEFKQIATDRYAAGLVSQQDPLQAEVELAHLEHRQVVLQTARSLVRARLNALMHRPPQQALPRPVLNVVPGHLDLDPVALQQQAVQGRPELRARRAQIESATARVALRRLERYPDFEATTTFNSMWAASEHRWMVGVGLNLPIQRRRIRAAITQAEARRLESELLRDGLEDTVRSEVQQACDRLQEAHHVVGLYEARLLPASRDQVQAALSGFKTSRNSFLALIDAERNLRTVEIEYEGAVAEFHRRSAALDRAVGRLPGNAPLQEPASLVSRIPAAERGALR